MTTRTDEIRKRLEAAELEISTGVYMTTGDRMPVAVLRNHAPADLSYLLTRVERLEALLREATARHVPARSGLLERIDAALGES